MKKFLSVALFAAAFSMMLAGCSGSNDEGGGGGGGGSESRVCTISSLSLEAKDNPEMGSSSYGYINDNLIYLTIPEKSPAIKYVLTFNNGKGSKLYADGQEIISGQTAFELEKVKELKSVAPAGNSLTYDIIVKRGISSIDKIVYELMTTYKVPGVSVSVSKDEQLVYSAGYGYANRDTKERVTSKTLFRLASMSKSQTAIAIMTLIEQGKLRITDQVFGKGGVLEYLGTEGLIPGATSISIQQCLEHMSGFRYTNDDDPMFPGTSAYINKYDNKSVEERIKSIITTEAITGTNKYYYDNANFAILGLVIEKVSGMKYEDYMKKYVWGPAGVTDIHVGRTNKSDKYPNETIYYPQNSSSGYGNDFNVIYALGGLIASTDELMKLMATVDYGTKVPDILKPETLDLMYEPSKYYSRYAKGWRVGHPNFPQWASYHTGNLSGTATMWVRGANGVNCVIVCNSRSYFTANSFLSIKNVDIDDALFYALRDIHRYDW